jgi:hypothetical protein
VGADEQSLPSNGGNARTQLGGGNAMVAEYLYPGGTFEIDLNWRMAALEDEDLKLLRESL